jgi:hypothetical protein
VRVWDFEVRKEPIAVVERIVGALATHTRHRHRPPWLIDVCARRRDSLSGGISGSREEGVA